MSKVMAAWQPLPSSTCSKYNATKHIVQQNTAHSGKGSQRAWNFITWWKHPFPPTTNKRACRSSQQQDPNPLMGNGSTVSPSPAHCWPDSGIGSWSRHSATDRNGCSSVNENLCHNWWPPRFPRCTLYHEDPPWDGLCWGMFVQTVCEHYLK